MEEVITTIYFDGQFWVALIEKIAEDGSLQLGKYTFGPEPTNSDLVHFYLNIYSDIPLYHTDAHYRVKKIRSLDEQIRCTKKSLVIYNAVQTGQQMERKSMKRRVRLMKQDEQYALKCKKRKEKKRGH